MDESSVPDYFPDTLPRFEAGQLVLHKRYGYRGVVVDFDMRCQAPDSWYLANQTQPDRDQPWYHILVHQTDRVTYAAEVSLSADQLGEPIEHPLLDHLFLNFESGVYRRSDMPWPIR